MDLAEPNAMAIDPPRIAHDSIPPQLTYPDRGVEADAARAPPRATGFARVLDAMGRETERGERAMRTALDPRQGRSDPTELLALQAAIYRYTELVDLASHLLDRASSALKTVLGGGS